MENAQNHHRIIRQIIVIEDQVGIYDREANVGPKFHARTADAGNVSDPIEDSIEC
jgi:hypothetical protein